MKGKVSVMTMSATTIFFRYMMKWDLEGMLKKTHAATAFRDRLSRKRTE